MIAKQLRCSILSLLLLLAAASPLFAAVTFTLTGISGSGTVNAQFIQPGFTGTWRELSAGTSYSLSDGAMVTLQAVAAPGYLFNSWSGDTGSLNDPTSATTFSSNLYSDKSIAAVFVPQNLVNVTLSGTGGGSVTLSDGTNACTVAGNGGSCAFADGSNVTLTATATAGSSFDYWTGVDSISNGIGQLAVGNTDHRVGAVFSAAGSSSGLSNATPAETTVAASAATGSTVAGCATSVGTDYTSTFDPADFQLINVAAVDNNSSLQLETGNAALDPNSIVIPFEQEVAVTFLYEGAGYDGNDLGWLFGNQDPATTTPTLIYKNINDNNNDGVLDDGILDNGTPIGDRNGDGVVNALDNRVSLGRFSAGDEIVFSLSSGYQSNSNPPTFYTKTDWNPDTWNGGCSGDSFTKTYHLGLALQSEGACSKDSNWMLQTAIDRLSSLFSLSFTASDTQTLSIVRGEKFSHVIVGTPADKPNEWILGWEDLAGGGDTDHNDMIFQIERKTGGSVQLLDSQALKPLENDAYFTASTLEVIDEMPGNGNSLIEYELSSDGGSNWVKIDHWDIVKGYPLDGNGAPITTTDLKSDGVDIADSWVAGTPTTTYRSVRIDFAGLNLSGDKLLWRANFTSDDEAYQPAIHNVQLSGEVATHGEISRSSPIILGNVLFDASYETPANSWTEKSLRGHLRARRIYDPTSTTGTDEVELWDAATQLQLKEPSTRLIKYPEMAVTSVVAEPLASGDGTNKTFRGTLPLEPQHHILATTVKISDNRETFSDSGTNDLVGSLSQGVTGTLNRFTGEYELTFNQAPADGVAIIASYSTYELAGGLRNFTYANTSNAVLALDASTVNGRGPVYDFNQDGSFSNADRNWLINWTRGYGDGATSKKEGILGPIDHSTPAVVSPPGTPAWYYGTSISAAERSAFDSFVTMNAERRSIALVGSRDGMLHAFDAGAFRHGDNPKTAVEENRGYYLWPGPSDSNYREVQDWWPAYLASLDSSNPPYFGWQNSSTVGPDYGTGKELWAFIPANLMPRLKNNPLNGTDRAYVDASPAIADVYIDSDDNGTKEWRTVVLSAEGNGGDSIFCLDITDTANPQFLWEFSDPQLFRSRSSPAVAVVGRIFDVNVSATKWVAFFVSGRNYDPGSYPAVYMVDIDTGSVLEKISLDAVAEGKGGVPSGQPAIVDSDGNGYIDRIYIGTDKGYLYKVNLPDSPSAAGEISRTVLVNVDFTDESNNSVAVTQRYHPIYASPTVVVDNGLASNGAIDYNVRVFFGTGDSPYYDENIDTGNTRYHFFAYNDKEPKNSISNNAIQLEWFYELPAGQRIFASAFAAAGQVYFGSASGETENPCEGPNSGRVFAFSFDGVSVLNDDSGNPGMMVGDTLTTPSVADGQLYIKTDGKTKSFGDGVYNKPVSTGGLPKTETTYWREIF